jgi:hypothetical protein
MAADTPEFIDPVEDSPSRSPREITMRLECFHNKGHS